MTNLIENGTFKGIPYNGDNGTSFLLEGDRRQAGGWMLYGANHSVRFLAQNSTSVLGNLPPELHASDIGFVCLNGTGSGLIGCQTNQRLPKGKGVRVTWWASTNRNRACSGSVYSHTVQFAREVEHPRNSTTIVDGQLYAYEVHSSDPWRQLSCEFHVVGDDNGVRYLSFKGDKSTGACGVVISGVRVELIEELETGFTIESNSDFSVAPGGVLPQLDFTVTKDRAPQDGLTVKASIDDADGTGTKFVSHDAVFIMHTTSKGVATIPAGEIVAGTKNGKVSIRVVVGKTERLFPINMKSTFLVERINPMPKQGVNGRYFEAAINGFFPAVEMTIVDTQRSKVPLQNHPVTFQLARSEAGIYFDKNTTHGDQLHYVASTDNEGRVSLPADMLRAGQLANVEGRLEVAVDGAVIAEGVYGLKVLNAPTYEYVLELVGGNPTLQVGRQSLRKVRLTRGGHPVPGIRVHAAISTKQHDAARISVASQHSAAGDVADETDAAGLAVFYITARASGSSAIIFTADRARPLSVVLTAGDAVTSTRLLVSGPENFLLTPGGKRTDSPITVSLNPEKAPIATVHYDITPKEEEGLHVLDGGMQNLFGNLRVTSGHATVEGLVVGNSTPKTYVITFSVEEHSEIAPVEYQVTVAATQHLHLYPEGLNENNRFRLDEGSVIERDEALYVLAYRDTTEKNPAPDAPLTFAIGLVGAQDASAVTFVAGHAGSEHRVTATADGNGKLLLPAVQLRQGWTGAFNIAVYTAGAGTPAGTYYFLVVPPLQARTIEFTDARQRLNAAKLYSAGMAGTVTVYADAAPHQAVVRSGSVDFQIQSGDTTGTVFVAGNNTPVSSMSSPIDSHGEAPIPKLKTGHAGSFTVVATVHGLSVSQTQVFPIT